jgi:hypothetical protein
VSFPEFSNHLMSVFVVASVSVGTSVINFATVAASHSLAIIAFLYFSIAVFTHAGALFANASATVFSVSVGYSFNTACIISSVHFSSS